MKLDNKMVAHRYGKALFEVTQERNETPTVQAELSEIKKVVLEEPELMVFLKSAQISRQAKRDALATLTNNTTELTHNLVTMLFDYGRITNLVGVVDEFNRLIDEFNKTVRAEVRTAVELDEDQKQKLASSFANVVGAERVVFETAVDPEIIGGVVITANNTVYDGSLRTKLNSIKRLLLK
ncbi:ATP synthase F1 subunit delta [Ligilactobacillus saerimneri]|uniref:ATP synthase subunit delta n=1 Tax=Ligilactobacillus saerimneri 30a TaxID=1227363 RepID=M5J4B3_9LACO|nr:ATP synthase F1 subunit delta [Ligilactobacillus saerimneri]EKW99013.1 ATP synthase subunit delta [Ligilactobacillus saerimneri 30a]